MLSLNYENINYVMTLILKLSCASFSYVNISYVLACFFYRKSIGVQGALINIYLYYWG